jgi:hypothetical protein
LDGRNEVLEIGDVGPLVKCWIRAVICVFASIVVRESDYHAADRIA